MKRPSLALFAALALSLSAFAADQTQNHAKHHKMPAHTTEAGGPDIAYMQKIWDGWSTMKSANVAEFYNHAPDHMFFDEAPLKYNNWQEYETGGQALLNTLKTLKLTVNDDAKIHHEGNLAWGYATIKEEDTTNSGKHEMATLRWTVIFEKDAAGKWLIAHEHVSVPAQ